MGAHDPIAVLPALYDDLTWVAPNVAAFPRMHRFTVGDRLFTSLISYFGDAIHLFRPEAISRFIPRRSPGSVDVGQR